jgi:hypothetical protein
MKQQLYWVEGRMQEAGYSSSSVYGIRSAAR